MADKKPGIDKDLIRELADLLKETDLSEIEIEHDDFRIRVARGGAIATTAVVAAEPRAQPISPALSEPAQSTAPLTDPARHPGCVPSPMVGTAYLSPEPGKSPFVEVGDQVQ